jgi:hypothetical protein
LNALFAIQVKIKNYFPHSVQRPVVKLVVQMTAAVQATVVCQQAVARQECAV